MPEGEVRFNFAGAPVVSLPVKDGAFSGDVMVGANRVDVIWEVDGPPHPMDPSQRIRVNKVDARFSGAYSPFNPNVPAAGASDLKFDVRSAR